MAESSAPSRDQERALSAFVRAEFETPITGLKSSIEILAEDIGKAGLVGYQDHVERMRGAAERLSGLVSNLLADPQIALRSDTSTLRHDLRTPVSSIIGYGELLAEEARDDGHPVVFAPLAELLDAAARVLKELDRLVAFSSSLHAGARDPDLTNVPDVLRRAVEIVGQLSRRVLSTGPAIAGRILVVDDNASMRDLVSRRLIREGHDVTLCSSGLSALRKAEEGSYDLMLLDLMMPGMNGLQVLERLRALPGSRALPVIVMSALDEVDAAVRCIEAGADDFLSKPLNETLLRARIASSLERKFLRDREQDAVSRLILEQERSQSLLRNVLPANVVDRLAAGEQVIADHFDEVTVLFCDLVGFTALSAHMSPAETLALLNDIFSGFDQLVEQHGLEKIKTIGDAYMVVGGMVQPSKDHASHVVRMALAMPDIVRAFASNAALDVRIGIDTGPAVAGIIGRQKFFYDVWGDTVNTASRLESLAEPGCIHVSGHTRASLDRRITCRDRGFVEVKGKGSMRTFYVER